MRLCGLNFAADPYISSFSFTVLWKKKKKQQHTHKKKKKKHKKKKHKKNNNKKNNFFFIIKLAQSFFEFCFCGNI